MKEVILTPEGYEQLKAELDVLRTEKRREIAERIAAAREFGEIAENAEYDDAKNEQMMLEHRIAQLEERLANARVIDTKDVDTSVVSIGSVVRLRDVDAKETIEYFIVGSAEANPAERKLSNESPGRQGDHGPQEGRDRRGGDAARREAQVQDHGDQGGVEPSAARRYGLGGAMACAAEAFPRPGRDRRRPRRAPRRSTQAARARAEQRRGGSRAA